MANVLTLNEKPVSLSNVAQWEFFCQLSGSYVQGGAQGVPGETLNFNGALNPSKFERAKIPSAPAGRLPDFDDIEVVNTLQGYQAVVERNATLPTAANFVLRIFTAGSGAAAPVELSAGAYPAGLTAKPVVIVVTSPSRYN